jgi:hypothetical protein
MNSAFIPWNEKNFLNSIYFANSQRICTNYNDDNFACKNPHRLSTDKTHNCELPYPKPEEYVNGRQDYMPFDWQGVNNQQVNFLSFPNKLMFHRNLLIWFILLRDAQAAPIFKLRLRHMRHCMQNLEITLETKMNPMKLLQLQDG